jgi:simple sugar transport system ATP-binding protein
MEGHALIFISHKLHEVMQISDRVTVLRDGRIIGTRNTAEVTRNELVTMMVGRPVKPLSPQPLKSGSVRLEISGLRAMGDRGTEALRGIDLQIHGGEILGLAGVSGNGQRELAECLAGVRKATHGVIRLDALDITSMQLKQRVDSGLAYVPEERMRDGAIREFSVQENVFLHDHASPKFTRWIFLDFVRMRAFATDLVDRFRVKTPSLDTPIKNLSGGNIQKLILARELSRQPRVLIASQPTRGVDIGATEYIHQRLLQQREEGTAILLISEDLDEIRVLSDRIAVLYEGRIMGIVGRDQATVDQIGLMMAGISMAEAMQRSA